MDNIFSNNYSGDKDDNLLISKAQKGDRKALEELIKKHQKWIYNIALRMVGSPDDAKDITQEILIKVITRLSTFEFRSSFRTWLYRIVSNHVIDMKRNKWERLFHSFQNHSDFNDRLEYTENSSLSYSSIDNELLVEETKTICMSGMLLCLDRMQRLVFILGAILGIESNLCGEFLGISATNFRQILSRARKQLGNFMNEKCGLINENNHCRCSNKTKACIEAGLVNPENLRFNKDYLLRVNDFVTEKSHLRDNVIDGKVQDTFRNQPFLKSPDALRMLNIILKQKEVNSLINFR